MPIQVPPENVADRFKSRTVHEVEEHNDDRRHRLEQDAKDREHRRREESRAANFRRAMLVAGIVIGMASVWVAIYGPTDTRSLAVNVCVGIVSAVAGSALSSS